MQHSRPTLPFKPLIFFPLTAYLLPLQPHHHLMLLDVSLHLLLPLLLPDSLRVLQWNAGGLWARNTELLHFISSHVVDLICIQESNLNLSSSFRIPGFSTLRSDRTHSQSCIFSTDVTHASDGFIIFVRQSLSFSELPTSSLSYLDPYSDYVGFKISLNNSSLLSFHNVYTPTVCYSATHSRTNSVSPSTHPFSRNLFILKDFNCHHTLWDSKVTSDSRGEEIFYWVISSDLLPSMTLTYLLFFHRSSGCRSSPDIFFAPSSLALSCSWK